MKEIVCKGRHAEICRLLSRGDREGTLQQIYSYFRIGDHNDTYSIQILTILRELIDDGESDELGRIRIRILSCGDRVLINLAQFVWALESGGYHAEAGALMEKCAIEIPRLSRSVKDLVEEEGVSPVYEMAGMRIREALRIMRDYCESVKSDEALEKCIRSGLDMTRQLLFSHPECIAEDMMVLAKFCRQHDLASEHESLCQEMVDSYGYVLAEFDAEPEFSRERFELLDCVRYAWGQLDEILPDHPYASELSRIGEILDESN